MTSSICIFYGNKYQLDCVIADFVYIARVHMYIVYMCVCAVFRILMNSIRFVRNIMLIEMNNAWSLVYHNMRFTHKHSLNVTKMAKNNSKLTPIIGVNIIVIIERCRCCGLIIVLHHTTERKSGRAAIHRIHTVFIFV